MDVNSIEKVTIDSISFSMLSNYIDNDPKNPIRSMKQKIIAVCDIDEPRMFSTETEAYKGQMLKGELFMKIGKHKGWDYPEPNTGLFAVWKKACSLRDK